MNRTTSAVIGTMRTPASMRTAFNRGNVRSDVSSRRVWDGRTWKRVDPAASGVLAWLKSEVGK